MQSRKARLRARRILGEYARGWLYAESTAPKDPDFEAKHPRAEDGRFGEKNGPSGDTSKDGGSTARSEQRSVGGGGLIDWGGEYFLKDHPEWEDRAHDLLEQLELDDDGEMPEGIDHIKLSDVGISEPLLDKDLVVMSMVFEREFHQSALADGSDAVIISGPRYTEEQARATGVLGSVHAAIGKGYGDLTHTHPAQEGGPRASAEDCRTAIRHWRLGGVGVYKVISYGNNGEPVAKVYRNREEIVARLREINEKGE